MKTKTLLLILAFMAGCLHSDAFRLVSTPMDSIVPVRNIIQDETGVTVSYEFPGAVAVQDNLYPESVNISIPGFGQNTTLGEPAWPLRIDSFEIPEGCDAEVSVVSSQWTDLGVSLAPSRPMLVDSSDEVHSLENVPPVSDFAGAKPLGPVAVNGMQTYRDRNILYVEVVPTKCINKTHTKACESLTYSVTYKASESEKLKKLGKIRHDVDEGFMSSLFTSTLEKEDTAEDILKAGSITRWRDAPYYLILSIPEYQSAVSDFMEWKKCMGFNVEAIYNDSWTPTTIKSAIQNFYDSHSNFQYVLLIGDAVSMPPVRHKSGNGSPYDHSSDYTYGCMDGDNDMEQDIIVGRLNVSNASETSIVVNKIINYERNPPENKSFYSNALHAAQFLDEEDDVCDNYEDRRFVRTSEDIRSGLVNSYDIRRVYFTFDDVEPSNWNNGDFGYGEAIPVELQKPEFKWDGSTSDVVESVNKGVLYVLHRGHGSYEGWSIPWLKTIGLFRFNNMCLLPIFFNIHCQSGAFGGTKVYVSTERTYRNIDLSFSEALLRKEEGGAVGIIAASEISYSGANDVLTMEMFHSIWPHASILTDFPKYTSDKNDNTTTPVYSLGKILRAGVAGLVTKYSGWFVPYTKRIFHCFGDPSMNMYTSQPDSVKLTLIDRNKQIVRTSKTVKVALIMTDGSVKISHGNEFDKTSVRGIVKKSSIFGHNIIPKVFDKSSIIVIPVHKSEITGIERNGDFIKVRYSVNENSNAVISVKLAVGNTDIVKVDKANSGLETISTVGLQKGIYIVELTENGVSVDCKKFII